MDNNNTYFYMSGLIALSLFSFFISLFAIMMFQTTKTNSYAFNKDNFISVSIEIPTVKKKSVKKVQKSVPVESVSQEKSENIDVNDLFSDVWAKKIVHKKEKPINSKRLQEIQKKIKKVEKNSVESLSNKVENLQSVTSNEQENSASTANEVNEYLAKIQAIVYQYFNVPPNSEGNSIKCVIELNALGKVMDFRILSYSANEALNQEADKIKERLQNVIFPINPQNKSSRTVVILISKE